MQNSRKRTSVREEEMGEFIKREANNWMGKGMAVGRKG